MIVEVLIAKAESIGRLSAFAATSFSSILSVEAAARLKPFQPARDQRA